MAAATAFPIGRFAGLKIRQIPEFARLYNFKRRIIIHNRSKGPKLEVWLLSECLVVDTEQQSASPLDRNAMYRSLLNLALVTTQLLSWSGGTFYLCLARDGSVQFDRSPQSCRRCEENHLHEHSSSCCSCCNHDCRHETEEAPSPSGCWQLTPDPCGCTHILILQEHLPTIRKSSSFDHLAKVASPLSLCVTDTVFPVRDDPAAATLRMRAFASPPAYSLVMLSSTVIRC